jgi:isopenicillin N synthase-like dioxygenase
MKVSVLTYMDQLTRIGHLLIRAIFESLGVPSHILSAQFSDPTILFRLFHYPPHNESYGPTSQPVGEHTDYGYLTLLRQDSTGGLQAKLRKFPFPLSPLFVILLTLSYREVNKEIVEEWIDVPPIPNTFVVNLGDALQHNTGGLLLATPHRVKQRINTSSSRYSFPLFFDPSFSSEMVSVEKLLTESDRKKAKANQQLAKGRWDHADPAQYRGIYGDYLVSKVTKVFPRLAVEVGLGKPTDSSPGGLGERRVAGAGKEL